MNLEIKKKPESASYEVYLDKIFVGYADDKASEEKEYHIFFEDIILDLATEYKIADFFYEDINSFNLQINNKAFEYLDWIFEDKSSIWLDYDLTCTLSIYPNFLDWSKPLSLSTFLGQLESRLNKRNIKTVFNHNMTEEGIYVTFIINPNNTIAHEYLRVLSILSEEVKNIFEDTSSSKIDNELMSIFLFPPEIRLACEQYLIYFSKFLEDLGIEVSSKLDSHTKETFFSIIPKDSDEALSKIKQLLDIYLTISEANDFEDSYSTPLDISVQQLMSNVYHLKSQLFLAKSAIQLKDATIESLKFTNYQQSLLLNSRTNNNEEKTLGGLITIDEYEGKGFKINLAEIFRILKRKFNQ